MVIATDPPEVNLGFDTYKPKRGEVMTVASATKLNPLAKLTPKGLEGQWRYYVSVLLRYKAGSAAEELLEQTRDKLRNVASEAAGREGNVELAVPQGMEDVVFAELGLESEAPITTAAVKTSRTAGKGGGAKTAAKAKVPRPKREKKQVVLSACGCGCGAQVPGTFKMGHDAKLHSMLLKTGRGQMKYSELPASVQKANPELRATNVKAIAANARAVAAREAEELAVRKDREEKAEARRAKRAAAAKAKPKKPAKKPRK